MKKLIAVIKIQSLFRGYLIRIKRLPNFLYIIKKYLESEEFICSSNTDDGRINSCLDEEYIIELLIKKFGKRIIKPKKRMWFDLIIIDYRCGSLPLNIKTTTLKTSDNIGNLALCVYAYTNKMMRLNKEYNNGHMSDILIKKLKNKEFNYSNKDYYFLVINKNNTKEIIINSMKGLTKLTPNINNLPFQICWKNNKEFKYYHINEVIKKFIDCINKSKPSWQEIFLQEMRNLTIN